MDQLTEVVIKIVTSNGIGISSKEYLIFDSLQMILLALQIENYFGIHLTDRDVLKIRNATIREITKIVEAKLIERG